LQILITKEKRLSLFKVVVGIQIEDLYSHLCGIFCLWNGIKLEEDSGRWARIEDESIFKHMQQRSNGLGMARE